MLKKLILFFCYFFIFSNVAHACSNDLKGLVRWELTSNQLAMLFVDEDGDNKADVVYYHPVKRDIDTNLNDFYEFTTEYKKEKVYLKVKKNYRKGWYQSDRKKLVIVETKEGRMYYYVPQDERVEILIPEITEYDYWINEHEIGEIEVIDKFEDNTNDIIETTTVPSTRNSPKFEKHFIFKQCSFKKNIEDVN